MKIIISKKKKKLISRIAKRCVRIIICGMLLMTQLLPVYASISASDGTVAVTKPEFNSVVADFNSRISKLELGTNTKIEAAVNEYLSKIEIGGGGAKGYVINDETEITGTKDATTGAYSNVTAIISIEIADLKIGDNIYVRDTSACNYYVSQVSPTISLSVLNKSINNVVDNLTSTDIDKPLSANMGKKLNDDKQDDIMANITGSANEVLARNGANNGLEFKEYISKQDMFDVMRPIHSTFIQYGANDNPNTLFNTTDITSTWTKVDITEGYIQLDKTKTAGTTITATATTDDHTLTINEMPKHDHNISNGTTFYIYGDTYSGGFSTSASHFNRVFNEQGGGQPHNHNLTDIHPKGQTAILWERTT